LDFPDYHEDAMRKKTKAQKNSPDSLLKTSKNGEIELTEQELGKVTGGAKITFIQQEASSGGAFVSELLSTMMNAVKPK
jgi:hypothetical protein